MAGERTPVISLGGGVQSVTLVLMAATGYLEDHGIAKPELAVFADTQWESAGTYEYLGWLRIEAWRGGVEIAQRTAGDLRADVAAAARGDRRRASNPPLFVRHHETGKKQMIPRGCSRDYKVRPVRQELRARGFGPSRPVVQYIGFTTDEVERMSPSDVAWASTAWPLIDLRMSRHDCERWLLERGYAVPPKSACVGCPMRSDASWRQMKVERPDEFAAAVEWDREVRTGLPGLKSEAFLHDSLRPLDEVDLRSAEDLGQLTIDGAQAACDTAGCFT